MNSTYSTWIPIDMALLERMIIIDEMKMSPLSIGRIH